MHRLEQPLLLLNNLTLIRDSMAVVTDGHLVIKPGEIVCLQGQNGSGKTSLAEMLAGSSLCAVVAGSVTFKGSNLLTLSPSERAQQGLYVAFQNVPEFDGVTAENFLYEAYAARYGERPARDVFAKKLYELCVTVGFQQSHLERALFNGFSGGERKRFQLLELLLLQPDLAVLDEVDAGLDAEGLKLFFDGIKQRRISNSVIAFLIITHNQTVIKELAPERCYELSEHTLRESSLREHEL